MNNSSKSPWNFIKMYRQPGWDRGTHDTNLYADEHVFPCFKLVISTIFIHFWGTVNRFRYFLVQTAHPTSTISSRMYWLWATICSIRSAVFCGVRTSRKAQKLILFGTQWVNKGGTPTSCLTCRLSSLSETKLPQNGHRHHFTT